MANRFNKGIDNLKQADNVQEIEPQTVDQQEETTTTEQVNGKKQTEINAEDNTIADIKEIAIANTKNNVNPNTLSRILDNVLVSEPAGANFTFYLSDDVSKAITKVAKEKKISKSKLVDTILRQVLLSK